MTAKRRMREGFYLFWGVIVGAVLGIFGNLSTNWYYDVNKNQPWMPLVAVLSFSLILVILGILTFYLFRWGREL
jgi:hypothetical protein